MLFHLFRGWHSSFLLLMQVFHVFHKPTKSTIPNNIFWASLPFHNHQEKFSKNPLSPHYKVDFTG